MENESARRALEALEAGNRRFREGLAGHPRQDAQRRAETAGGQRPFAAIVACSDSRVPPEILFDQGIGDLFVVRTAGGVLDRAGLGSVEYAIEHLRVPLVVVLGHTSCGAVRAALAGGETRGGIAFIVETLRPAVERALRAGGDTARAAVLENVAATVSLVSSSGPAAVIGAVYDVESGEVLFLPRSDVV